MKKEPTLRPKTTKIPGAKPFARRDDSEIVLINIRATVKERRDLHQLALDMDTNVKEVVFQAVREFRERHKV